MSVRGGDLRTPPHSIEAEQAVLGGLLLDSQSWDNVADVLRSDDFYRKDHRLIFEAIGLLAAQGQPCDVVTISESLGRHGQLAEVGGLPYLAGLARDTPTAANVRAYAQIVRERSLLRQLLHAGTEIAASVFNNEGESARELVEGAESKVFAIAEQGVRGSRDGAVAIQTLLPTLIDQIDDWHNNPAALRGLPSGFDEFDRKTGGLRPGDLVVVAGRPSMGKTTFAVNMAEYAALKQEVRAPVVIFSMEMPAEQLMSRMLSSIGRVSLAHIRSGQISDDDWPRITGAAGQLSEAKIFIDETPALTPTELRARARRVHREHGLGMVVVDYLQLMQVPGNKENRATEIAEISRGLKALAKELRVPVIALSQLNRGVEQRVDKKPVMSDLRECVTGDTRVWLADGSQVPIRELVGQRPEVWSRDAAGEWVKARAEIVWSVGHKSVQTLRLANGRTLRATPEHRLLTDEGWKTLAELAVGDRVAVAGSLSAAGALGGVLSGAAAPGAMSFEPVVVIEPAAAALEEVFDLTVPGPANWLSSELLSHNSGAIEQDADMILLIYREEVYDKNTTKKGMAEIDLAKHRNGETGTFLLTFQGQYSRFVNYAPDSYAEGVLRG